MRSSRPKPLHMLCGRPLVRYVLDAVAGLRCRPGRGRGGLRRRPRDQDVAGGPGRRPARVRRAAHRRTAPATPWPSASPACPTTTSMRVDTDDGDVLVLPGDTPLIRPATLAALVLEHRLSGAACTLLTARMDDPTGYGRVVRDKDGRVRRIVEHRDADETELRDRRDQHEHLRVPPQPAGAGAAPHHARQRTGRAVRHRRGRRAGRGRAPGRVAGGRRCRRDAGRQRPGPAGGGRGRAAPPHQRALDARGGGHRRPRAPPTSTRP